MPNTYIDKNSYYRLVTSLMEGREFVEDVANELWMQAAGDRQANELRVDDICSTIVDAQNILRTKIAETNDEINSHEMEKKRFQANQSK